MQNASPASQLGAVTSATQFYRSIGGALGLAVLGSFMANRFAAGLQDSLPPAIRQSLPADQLARMEENPQALVNPQALEGLKASFADQGPQGAEAVAQLIASLRETLASAISSVFVVVAVALAIAFVVTIFLREVPLRGGESKEGHPRTEPWTSDPGAAPAPLPPSPRQTAGRRVGRCALRTAGGPVCRRGTPRVESPPQDTGWRM